MRLLFDIDSSLNLVERTWHLDESYNFVLGDTCK